MLLVWLSTVKWKHRPLPRWHRRRRRERRRPAKALRCRRALRRRKVVHIEVRRLPETMPQRQQGEKALLLRYGEGGENYAHKDHQGDLQALLMLSQPGVDYGGGAFFVASHATALR